MNNTGNPVQIFKDAASLAEPTPCDDSDEALLRLEEHKRDTAKRWQDFNAEHQVLQQLGVLNGGQGPPRLHDLLQAAQDAEAAWKKKKDHGLGKTKSAIGNFMNTMNSHSCLFSVIPNNDKYTSLITGVITSIAKVCYPSPLPPCYDSLVRGSLF